LFYGTGGLAYGRVKTFGAASFTGTFTDTGGPCDSGGAGCPASGSAAFSDSRTKLGWTLGAGIEGAVSPSSNWTWRVEYLYVDLGTANATAPFSSSVSVPGVPLTQTISGTGSSSARVTDQIVRFGINYKFGGDALAARY
jgi:outer membrane immunogenic protein